MIGKESPSRLIRVCRHGVSEGGLLFRKQLKESGKRGPKDLKETTFARAGGWRDGEHERERERGVRVKEEEEEEEVCLAVELRVLGR